MNKSLFVPKKNNRIRVLQITDTHLFADESKSLMGINTNQSLKAVLDQVEAKHSDIDMIIATGDFVQDGSSKAYQHFVDMINPFSLPCAWLPGNHDIYSKMKSVFERNHYPEKKIVLLGDKWLAILLNSQIPGEPAGELAQSELSFLIETLNKYPDRYAMVFLHHNPVSSSCRWLDAHHLKNHHEFVEIISRYKRIKLISWGHIHQEKDLILHHCQAVSTPSTCFQFKPNCENFAVDACPPGWRIIELYDDGEILTQVHFVDCQLFDIDDSQCGY